MMDNPSRLRFVWRSRWLVAASLAVASLLSAAELSVDGRRFVDAQGRQVILHGLNAVRKSDTWGSYDWLDEAGYARMHDWGVNCVRLGFTWAALEPKPGEYSEDCLRWLERHVAWARQHDIFVLLDFHQDLYAQRFSDGAPEWATLTDGLPHVAAGEAWSEAYVTSPAVQRAMDNFYANRPAADGVGLQEHYARAWMKVAERFASAPNVIGYDLMNEPFAGSLVPQGMGLMMGAAAKELNAAGRNPPIDVAGIAAMWADPKQRVELLQALSDGAVYGRVADGAEPLYREFDRTVLQPFYQRVATAIRSVDRTHLVFFENNGAGNMGVCSALEPLVDATGHRDPRQAFAPHGYDLVTDTDQVAQASNGRIALIFQRHDETAARLNLPMLVGEWGAFYGHAGARPAAEFICREFERLRCGDLYWAARPDFEQHAMFDAFCRPYPMRVAGELVEYRFDPATGEFLCRWREAPGATAPTEIFLPRHLADAPNRIVVESAGTKPAVQPRGNAGNSVVSIAPRAAGGERVLRIVPAPR